MKLANPRKFRKATAYLLEYLFQSTGIEHYDEWCGEVKWVREEIDPKDYSRFDAQVKEFEKLAAHIFPMVKKAFDAENKYQERLQEIYEEMWEETKVKKKAK